MTWVVALESVTQWLGEAGWFGTVKMVKGGQESWGLCAVGGQWGLHSCLGLSVHTDCLPKAEMGEGPSSCPP